MGSESKVISLSLNSSEQTVLPRMPRAIETQYGVPPMEPLKSDMKMDRPRPPAAFAFSTIESQTALSWSFSAADSPCVSEARWTTSCGNSVSAPWTFASPFAAAAKCSSNFRRHSIRLALSGQRNSPVGFGSPLPRCVDGRLRNALEYSLPARPGTEAGTISSQRSVHISTSTVLSFAFMSATRRRY